MDITRIERKVELKAPVSRVWKALTDHNEFKEWFGVSFESPFSVGQVSRGRFSEGDMEGKPIEITVKAIEPERLFSYTWHPYAFEAGRDYSSEIPTVVEFSLTATRKGTELTVRETGFDTLPQDRRDEAFREHKGGWKKMLRSVERHVARAEREPALAR